MVFFFIILSFLSIVVIVFLPKYQVSLLTLSDPLEVKNLENELRRTIIQLIGGIFLVLGAYLSWNTYAQTKERDFAQQLNKIISLMGNNKDYVKIGAIYSLKQITENHEDNYDIVLNILTSYLRDYGKWQDTEYSSNVELRQSLLSVINSIRVYNTQRQIDLSHLDLKDLSLQSMNLKNIKFIESYFNSSDLKNSNFDNSILSGSSFNNANLESTSFKNCDLRYTTFKRANIRNANFSGADLRGLEGYDKFQIKQQSIIDKHTLFD